MNISELIDKEFDKEYEKQQFMKMFFEWKNSLLENEKIDKSKEFIYIL